MTTQSALLFNFQVDKQKNQITVERSFEAPIDLVWAAWTESDILDQWWAPKPYRNETVSQSFTEGGIWHYFMESPEGERHYCLFEYQKIVPGTSYSGMDSFCDEHAVMTNVLPRAQWDNSFESQGEQSKVTCLISYEKLEDLEQIIAMGFKEGFTMGLQNLDQYIAAQFYLRKSKKPDNRARVSSYLNFPGNTEEAFEFYKSVFRTDYVDRIQRFGDIPSGEGQPETPESVKKMVLHVELPTVGGHLLMGTDAPKEMGFEVKTGNNMHINLEPETKEETKRIFHALAKGGNISMPLQDMFWGAYYGSVTDKYGINWMLNFQTVAQ